MTRGYMATAQRQDWETPPEIFDALDKEFGPFDLDPACTPNQYSAKTIYERGGRLYIDPAIGGIVPERMQHDGLFHHWLGRVYLNPPYGRDLPHWIDRAVSEVECGTCERVVALIPAHTDTRVWQKYVIKDASHQYATLHPTAAFVRFLPGRIRFVGARASAPFPSAVVVWE